LELEKGDGDGGLLSIFTERVKKSLPRITRWFWLLLLLFFPPRVSLSWPVSEFFSFSLEVGKLELWLGNNYDYDGDVVVL